MIGHRMMLGVWFTGALSVGLTLAGMPPDNDSCSSARPLAVGDVVSGTTIGATGGDGVPDSFCGTSVTAPGVWYEVSGTGRWMTASTCPTVGDPARSGGFDTKLSLLCPTCNLASCITGNDDAPGCGLQSEIRWCSNHGALYQLLVHGFGASTGAFELAISDGPDCQGSVGCFGVPVILGACCDAGGGCRGNSPQASCQPDHRFQGFQSSCRTTVGRTYFEMSPEITIPDHDDLGVVDTVHVPQGFLAYDVAVGLTIQHDAVGELVIDLTSPMGTRRTVWWRSCDTADAIRATAANRVSPQPDCTSIESGPMDSVHFAPSQSFIVFDGEPATGDWILRVRDLEPGNTGTLYRWSLQFAETEPTCPSNPSDHTEAGREARPGATFPPSSVRAP